MIIISSSSSSSSSKHRSPRSVALVALLRFLWVTLIACPSVVVITAASAAGSSGSGGGGGGGVEWNDDVPREKAKMPKLKPRVWVPFIGGPSLSLARACLYHYDETGCSIISFLWFDPSKVNCRKWHIGCISMLVSLFRECSSLSSPPDVVICILHALHCIYKWHTMFIILLHTDNISFQINSHFCVIQRRRGGRGRTNHGTNNIRIIWEGSTPNSRELSIALRMW